MSEARTTTCPRCQKTFECNAANIAQCQCQSVAISDAARRQLGMQYTDCLCAQCLQEVQAITEQNKST